MDIQKQSFQVFQTILLILITTMMVANQSEADIVLVETFNGSGSHAAGNVPGFDNDDWVAAGVPGAFTTNSFGEQVLRVENAQADPLNGVFRVIGTQPYEIVAEFSNPSADDYSAFGMTISDYPNTISFNVFKQSNGSFTALFGADENGNSYLSEHFSLGTSLDRFTLKTTYLPDLANGGGLFNFWIDTEESGNYMYLGRIDGTQYSINATSGRTVFLGTRGIFSDASLDIDHLTISSIPEPATIGLIAFACVGMAMRRKRR